MFRKLENIRFTYIRSHLSSLFLTSVTVLSTLLTIHILFTPEWLNLTVILVVIALYIVVGLIIAVYNGFKSSTQMKDRLDYVSLLITQYANGNYQSRIHFNDHNEIARIGNELNELGEKLQTQVRSLQRMADEKSAFAKSAYKTATIEERQRLARDLHDSVSQQLFALTMMSEAALKQLDSNPDLVRDQIEDVVHAGQTAQIEMRALLLHLRPVYLSGDSLPKGIARLVAELREKSELHFTVQIHDDLALSSTIEEHVFRIIQESLSNILRHAHATAVTLEIYKRANELFIHINDNGTGFDLDSHSERTTSYGLKIMQERSEELGGTFMIRSSKGEGSHIDIRIPC